MKQVFILALLCVWMFSCNESAGTQTDSVRVTDTPIIDTIPSVKTDTVAKKDTVVPADPTYRATFHTYFTSTYCGGARPSQEILADKATPKALSFSWIKFKNHFTGKEYVLQTNSEGIASGEMEEGKYDVFFTKDINPALGTGFDPKCKLWTDQLLLTVKVGTGGKSQDVTLHFLCNPCDENMKRQ